MNVQTTQSKIDQGDHVCGLIDDWLYTIPPVERPGFIKQILPLMISHVRRGGQALHFVQRLRTYLLPVPDFVT